MYILTLAKIKVTATCKTLKFKRFSKVTVTLTRALYILTQL